ncbi:MAG TPA: ThiF family adenylyltransferase [Gemmataceae bacterium]|nr:ThiF family adenylyltransferase [Gemmataceae bacterium]
MSEVGFCELEGEASAVAAVLAERLPRFVGFPGDAVPTLAGLKAGVIGNGAVGRDIAVHLARLQPAALWLCDRGRYKAESLLTQSIAPNEVGSPKATSTGRVCKAISPRTAVFVCDGAVEDLPTTGFADADVVALATDNLAAEVEVGQRCLWLGRPLVQASVHGETLVAQVRYFTNREGGACPACGFSGAEWAHLNRETSFSCEGATADRRERQTTTLPTMSVSFLCGLAANLACMQILRHVLNLGMPLTDSLVEYCGYTHRTVTASLTHNPECVCDHTTWERRTAPAALRDCTPAQLAESAGLPLADVSFQVHGSVFAELLICNKCGRSQPGGRFVAPGQSAGPCSDCGSPTRAAPFYSHDPVPAGLLPGGERSLGQLGAESVGSVIVRGAGRAVWFRH